MRNVDGVHVVGHSWAEANLTELSTLYYPARRTRDGGFWWKPKPETGKYPGFLKHGYLYFRKPHIRFVPTKEWLEYKANMRVFGDPLTPLELAPFYELALFGAKPPKK